MSLLSNDEMRRGRRALVKALGSEQKARLFVLEAAIRLRRLRVSQLTEEAGQAFGEGGFAGIVDGGLRALRAFVEAGEARSAESLGHELVEDDWIDVEAPS